MKMEFQVADVRKPLIAAKRLVERGNTVTFGPGKEDNYIRNTSTGDKVLLRPNGRGTYLLDVNFVGGERTSITVDSGAEESVCPWGWGEQYPVTQGKTMSFKSASGGVIEHYGKREVVVSSPF